MEIIYAYTLYILYQFYPCRLRIINVPEIDAISSIARVLQVISGTNPNIDGTAFAAMTLDVITISLSMSTTVISLCRIEYFFRRPLRKDSNKVLLKQGKLQNLESLK